MVLIKYSGNVWLQRRINSMHILTNGALTMTPKLMKKNRQIKIEYLPAL